MNVEFDFFDDFPLFRIANGYLLTSMPNFGGRATEVKPIEVRMRKIAFYVKKALSNFDGSAAIEREVRLICSCFRSLASK